MVPLSIQNRSHPILFAPNVPFKKIQRNGGVSNLQIPLQLSVYGLKNQRILKIYSQNAY